MARPLPTPRTANDELLAAVVDRLERVAGVLDQIRDRLPEPADDILGGLGPAYITEPAPHTKPAAKATSVAPKRTKIAPAKVEET